MPDSPLYLGYDDRVVIEMSVDLQWVKPFYTGGVHVANYTVSNMGQEENVTDGSVTVSYTTSGLVYGEVLVSAINYCGLKSDAVAINIPAAGDYLLMSLF